MEQKLEGMQYNDKEKLFRIGMFIEFSKELGFDNIKPILKETNDILEELKSTDDIDTLKLYLINILINKYTIPKAPTQIFNPITGYRFNNSNILFNQLCGNLSSLQYCLPNQHFNCKYNSFIIIGIMYKIIEYRNLNIDAVYSEFNLDEMKDKLNDHEYLLLVVTQQLAEYISKTI